MRPTPEKYPLATNGAWYRAVMRATPARGTALNVLMALAVEANAAGVVSQFAREIAATAHTSEGNTRAIIRRLRRAGAVVLITPGNGRRPSTYRVLTPRA